MYCDLLPCSTVSNVFSFIFMHYFRDNTTQTLCCPLALLTQAAWMSAVTALWLI